MKRAKRIRLKWKGYRHDNDIKGRSHMNFGSL